MSGREERIRRKKREGRGVREEGGKREEEKRKGTSVFIFTFVRD